MSDIQNRQTHDVIVLGAGDTRTKGIVYPPFKVVGADSTVIGLTCALELAQKGLKVVIIARDLPEDIHSTSFSSPWAGASFAPWAETPADVSREERTFKRLSKIARERPDLVAVTKFRYGWNTPGAYTTPLSASYLPDWRSLPPEECPGKFKLGIGFTSLTLNPPLYTLHLLSQLSELGVQIHRHRVSSIYEAFSPIIPASPPSSSSLSSVPKQQPSSQQHLRSNLVINATGLGSLSLLGVNDPLVHPAKGQTMTVRAPMVKECLGWKEPRQSPSEQGQQVYIIPRPGSGGLVTIGGCYLSGDWSTHVDPKVAERIWREAQELCPELSGEGVEVISHNVGLRPCRKGGIRIQAEEIDLSMAGEGVVPGQSMFDGREGTKGVCIHAYGIGGAGYQDSFGVAEDVLELVMAQLAKKVKE